MVFKPGQSGNPLGSKPNGFQSFTERAGKWLTQYSLAKIREEVEHPKFEDKYSSIDIGVLKYIYHALKSDDNEQMEKLFDRVFNKPKQETINTNTNVNIDTKAVAKEADEKADVMLAKIAARKAKDGPKDKAVH